jgi:hypothetical protein
MFLSRKKGKNKNRAREGGLPAASIQEKKTVRTVTSPGISPSLLTGGIPNRVRVSLKYTEVVAASTATNQYQVYRGNDVFDPNFTGAGGQPYNFDDWAIFFKRYRVLGSSFRMTYVDVKNNAPYSITCYPDNTSSNLAYPDAAAVPGAKSHYSMGIYTDSQRDKTISMSARTFDILGEPIGDRFQALVTTNPGDIWYWHTTIQSTDGSTTIGGQMHFEIVYDTEFFDRNPLTLDEHISALIAMRDNREKRKLKAPAESKTPTIPGNFIGAGGEEGEDGFVRVPRSLFATTPGGPGAMKPRTEGKQ